MDRATIKLNWVWVAHGDFKEKVLQELFNWVWVERHFGFFISGGAHSIYLSKDQTETHLREAYLWNSATIDSSQLIKGSLPME